MRLRISVKVRGVSVSIVSQTITAEELLKLPRGKMRYELVKGELLSMSPFGSEHGAVTFHLSTVIGRYVAATGAGLAFGAETGFMIERNPDTVRAPDIAFIHREHIPAGGLPQGFWPGAPDLAVEVVSPGDTTREVEEKANDWLRGGAMAVWAVNPRLKTVSVYSADGTVAALAEGSILDGGDVLPGFRCQVSELFRFPTM